MTIEHSGRRDESWFDDPFREYHAVVLAYARRRADDVVAEVFGTAWRSRSRVPDEPLPWLLRAAGNHTLHAKRSYSRRIRLQVRAVAGSEPTPDHADAVAGRQDAHVLVTQAIAELGSYDQEILRLMAWEQLTIDQVASVLGCSSGAARVRLHRARRRFEGALTKAQKPVAHPDRSQLTVEETRP